MKTGQNSQEAELKRRRISLRGKIGRREAAIMEARADIYRMSMELNFIERDLAEYRTPTTSPTPGAGR